MTSRFRIVGIRHHSPACARLVAHAVAAWRPDAVLIEGPGDFNARMPELLLDHRLPIALYSYANGTGNEGGLNGGGLARCWFPFLEHSPEWIALRAGHAAGAAVRFMDLPHWLYRAASDETLRTAGMQRPRYAAVTARLCERFGCDSDDALWDHLFESADPGVDASGHLLPSGEDEARAAALEERLAVYFDDLRGDDPGTPQDQARERHMTEWLTWAGSRFQRVLVVCGGWHKPVLDRAARAMPAAGAAAESPEVPAPLNALSAGSYLVPYEHRAVDALGGYRAGLPSSRYYRWVWRQGGAAAAERAKAAMARRLRQSRIALSTADLIALEHSGDALAALRGHPWPLRSDVLDALQLAAVKEAMETPAPWSDGGVLRPTHHPVLREALAALTGQGGGALHADTPQPPLLRDVFQRLEAHGLTIDVKPVKRVLDRREARDVPASRTLWQLKVLEIDGVRLLETRAPHAARGLSPSLRFEEHWQLQRSVRWDADLIEAAAHGATLPDAARHGLLRTLEAAQGDVGRLTVTLLEAIRAGLLDLGQAIGERVRDGLPGCHDHGALAVAAKALADVAQAGFWGEDPRPMLEDTLARIADRLLRLLEDRERADPASISGGGPMLEADVQGVRVFDRLLTLNLPGMDIQAVIDRLRRLALSAVSPPALRGAALGVLYTRDASAAPDEARSTVMAVLRTMPVRDALGDFLYGLFASARALATADDGIIRALHTVLETLGAEDFLTALPSLRAALGWFPPRERGQLARQVAELLGREAKEVQLRRPDYADGRWLDARVIEAQALAWAAEMGLT